MAIGEAKRKEVVVDFEEYKRMCEAELFLNALQAVGVDSWGGYSEAWELFHEWQKEDTEQ